ncbi:MAG: hypothetical protein QW487_07560 [Candidatus Bathyarchaeia archaeon]|nr:hypothetical protein [Candidatus Bathyarchaeota archaeon]
MQIKHFKPLSLLLLSLFIASSAFEAIYAFSYVQAGLSSVKAEASSTVSFEGVTLTFSSIKPYYSAGEKAVFYIDVLNLRDQPINRIDFSLKVKALSLFSIQAMKVEDYSTRVFNPGKPERITIERTMPMAIPPGFFALELVAKPASIASLPPATIIVYIKPSRTFFIAPLIVSLFSMVALCFSIFIAYTGIEALRKPLPKKRFKACLRLGEFTLSIGMELPALRSLTARKLGILMLLAEAKISETISAFSIGQKFVFSGICILIAAAFTLSAGLEQFANQLAILTYFALVIGVVNLIWENLKVKHLPKISFPLRVALSLLAFNTLVYFSAMPTVLTGATIFASLLALRNTLVKK